MTPNRNNSFWMKLNQKMHFKSTTNAVQQRYEGTTLQMLAGWEQRFTLQIHFYWSLSLVNADIALL